MRLPFRTLPLYALILATLVTAAPPAVADEDEPETVAVPQWTSYGPVPAPSPAFHEASRGGFDLDAVLQAATFPDGKAPYGDTVRKVGPEGVVELSGADGTTARAWLRAFVSTDRYRELTVTAVGSSPRLVRLDGETVAHGGADGAEVEATLKLSPGSHRVEIVTVHADANEAWTAGMKVAKPGEGDPGAAWSVEPHRVMTIRDVLDAPSVRSVRLSPDGSLVLAELTGFEPGTDHRLSWVEVLDAASGETMRSWPVDGGARQFAWVPAGAPTVSFVRKDGDRDTHSLWTVPVDSGPATRVLHGVEHWGGYHWSRDAGMVAYWTSVEPEKNETGIKILETILDRQAGHDTKSYLHVLDVASGARRRVTAGPESTYLLDFSPDGKKLLFGRAFEDLSARPYSRSEVWEQDLDTLSATKLFEGFFVGSVTYSPDGTRMLVEGGPSLFDRAGSALAAGAIPNDYDTQLYIRTIRDGSVDPITRDFDPTVGIAVWSPHDGAIYLTARDKEFVRPYRYDVEAKTFTALDAAGVEVVRRFDVATEAAVAVLSGSGVWQDVRVVRIDLETGEAGVVRRPGEAYWSGLESGEVRPWTFTSSAGDVIDGRVYLPPGFDDGRTWPAIVYYYGGTSPVDRTFIGRYPKEWWATRGYVVYVLQPSGTVGYGQEFSARHVNDWGKTTVGEIVEGTKKFLEAHPFVDPARVGCIGASYGGFMTMRLVASTDLFAAAVSHAGISALSSYWGEGYWGYSYGAVANADSFPWNRPDLFVDHSALFQADRIKTPLLLTHGDTDPNVPPGESDQMFIALRLLGTPVEYLSVAGQAHWIMDHDKRLRWSDSIVAWFDRWLKDRPEWWEAMYPSPAAEPTP